MQPEPLAGLEPAFHAYGARASPSTPERQSRGVVPPDDPALQTCDPRSASAVSSVRPIFGEEIPVVTVVTSGPVATRSLSVAGVGIEPTLDPAHDAGLGPALPA